MQEHRAGQEGFHRCGYDKVQEQEGNICVQEFTQENLEIIANSFNSEINFSRPYMSL